MDKKELRLKPEVFRYIIVALATVYAIAVLVTHEWGVACFASITALAVFYCHLVLSGGRWR